MVSSSVHPGTQSLLAHGARGGDPVQVPRGLRRLFPEARRPCHPTQTPLIPQVLPRDEEGVVRRLAVRPAASPFFGEGVEGRGERGAGLVGGTWISAPWFWASSGELVDAVAPSVARAVADVLAALPGPRRRGNAARVMPPGPA